MNTITIELSPQTAKLFGTTTRISERQFKEILEKQEETGDFLPTIKSELQSEDFMDFSEFKKIVTLQKMLRKLGLDITDETKLLHIKNILEDEKVSA